jgi:hypothetical protein
MIWFLGLVVLVGAGVGLVHVLLSESTPPRAALPPRHVRQIPRPLRAEPRMRHRSAGRAGAATGFANDADAVDLLPLMGRGMVDTGHDPGSSHAPEPSHHDGCDSSSTIDSTSSIDSMSDGCGFDAGSSSFD